jgi:hypothetical protein
MDNIKPKRSRAEINDRVWRAVEAASINNVTTLAQIVLTRAQANWLTPDRQGMSLLCNAVYYQSTDAIKWLLEKGADPNTLFENKRRIRHADAIGDESYISPFYDAIRSHNIEIIAAFLDHGALLSLRCPFPWEKDCGDLLDRRGLSQAVNAYREKKHLAQVIPTGTLVQSGTSCRL